MKYTVALCCAFFCLQVLAGSQTFNKSGFGTTHFIVGYDHTVSQKKAESTRVHASRPGDGIDRVLFTPKDNVEQALIELIDAEQKSIKVAVFAFTNMNIARALVRAHQRGIKVTLVVDITPLSDRYSKVAWIKQNGIPVHVYRASGGRRSLMHNKFMVFERNAKNEPVVSTGSSNFTGAGCKGDEQKKIGNQENVLIISDAYTVKQYDNRFDCIKNKCSGQPSIMLSARPQHRRFAFR